MHPRLPDPIRARWTRAARCSSHAGAAAQGNWISFARFSRGRCTSRWLLRRGSERSAHRHFVTGGALADLACCLARQVAERIEPGDAVLNRRWNRRLARRSRSARGARSRREQYRMLETSPALRARPARRLATGARWTRPAAGLSRCMIDTIVDASDHRDLDAGGVADAGLPTEVELAWCERARSRNAAGTRDRHSPLPPSGRYESELALPREWMTPLRNARAGASS